MVAAMPPLCPAPGVLVDMKIMACYQIVKSFPQSCQNLSKLSAELKVERCWSSLSVA